MCHVFYNKINRTKTPRKGAHSTPSLFFQVPSFLLTLLRFSCPSPGFANKAHRMLNPAGGYPRTKELVDSRSIYHNQSMTSCLLCGATTPPGRMDSTWCPGHQAKCIPMRAAVRFEMVWRLTNAIEEIIMSVRMWEEPWVKTKCKSPPPINPFDGCRGSECSNPAKSFLPLYRPGDASPTSLTLEVPSDSNILLKRGDCHKSIWRFGPLV